MKDFNNLLKEIGLTRKEFAEMIGVTEGSLGVMLSPMKDKEPRPIPKWVTSALIVADRLKKTREFLKERIKFWENLLIIERESLNKTGTDLSEVPLYIMHIESMISELKMILESEQEPPYLYSF